MKKRCLGWLLCCFLCAETEAQFPITFTSDDGLSNTCIRSFTQDSYQNVWICTQNGLNRYDGAKMNVYHHKNGVAGTLNHDNVTSVLELRPGTMLVGTELGVQSYEYATDRFNDIALIDLKGDSTKAHVVSMMLLPDSMVYATTAGYGLYRMEEKDGRMAFNQVGDFPVAGEPTRMMGDTRGRTWVMTAQGDVWVIDRGKVGKVGNYPGALKFCESVSGVIYLAAQTGGLYRYSEDFRTFRKVEASRNLVVASANPMPDGRLLVSTDGNGLMIYNEATGEMGQSNIRTYEYNLAISNVKDAIVDVQGNIWVGVYWKEVLVMPNVVTNFEYVGRRSVQRNTLGTNCVTTIVGDGHGDLWVATDHCGVYHLSADGTRSIHFKPELVKGMPSTVMSILEDSEGTMWLGSSYSGVAYMNKETGECVNISTRVPGGERIPNAYALVEDGRRNVWIGTMGDGLYRYNLRTRELLHYTQMRNNTLNYPFQILNNTYVRALMVHAGNLYVGSSDGLEVMEIKDDELRLKDRVLLKHGIRDIKAGGDGVIWVATTQGLMRWSTREGSIKAYTMDEGLPNNAVTAIEISEEGDVWVSTDDGLACFDPEKETFENYYIEDGLQGNEFSVAASYSMGGNLYFGGINGLTFFRPGKVVAYEGENAPGIRVVDFFLNGRPVHVGDRSGRYAIVDRWISEAGEVDLSHGDQSFSIELSTMDFNDSRATYYYSVNGGDWEALENGQNRIYFSNMEPGTYHIRMKAEAYGKSSEVRELVVAVHPAWYLSPWAKAVYVLFVVSLCYVLFLQWRERNRSKRMIEEHRKAEEINEARIQFFMNISHEIRTPMTLIISPLMKLMKLDTDALHQRYYSLIYQNSQRILRLVNQLMDARKIEKGQFRLRYRKVELVSFIENLHELFEGAANTRGISFTFRHPMEKFTVCLDPQNFDKVVMNLLSNAFKFTPDGGAVTIELEDVEGRGNVRDFVLTVTDTGIGIPDASKAHVFERFYAGNWGGDYVGTGIGLNLTKLLVELHHGDIRIEDNPTGQGTRFIVRMPQEPQPGEEVAEDTGNNGKSNYSERLEAAHAADVAVSQPDEKVSGKRHYRVLVVDDEVPIRQYLRSELSSIYYVAEAGNGKEAYDYLIQNADKVNLVISDVMMPQVDGIALCRKVKGNFNLSHIPVVLLTAKSEDADRLAGLSVGADAYLSKPFNIDVLRQTVATLLENRRKMQGKFGVVAHQEEDIDEPSDMTSRDDVLMERVMKIINENMSNPDLSVEYIADQIGISRVHLHRRLKHMTSATPRDFLRNVRLTQAAKLLSKKNYDIGDVSVAVGFRSSATFATSFKTYFGLTPTEYMKRNQEKGERGEPDSGEKKGE